MAARRLTWFAPTLMLSIALGAGGCKMLEEAGDSSSSPQPPTTPTPASPTPVSDLGLPAGYGNIPGRAERVASGPGKIEFRASRGGTIWVGNEDRRFTVVSHAVQDGDRIEVFPDRDRVELNDQPIFQQNLEKDDKHAIFFRDRRARGDGWSDAKYGNIRPDATGVASGRGPLSWHAPGNGEIWIGDDDLKKVLLSRRVKSGDFVELSLDPDQIKVNGKVVFSQNLESKHEHSIFYRP